MIWKFLNGQCISIQPGHETISISSLGDISQIWNLEPNDRSWYPVCWVTSWSSFKDLSCGQGLSVSITRKSTNMWHQNQQILRYSYICSYTKNTPYPKRKQAVLKQNLTTEAGIIKMQIRLKVSYRSMCFDGNESEKAETRVKRVNSSEKKLWALGVQPAHSVSGKNGAHWWFSSLAAYLRLLMPRPHSRPINQNCSRYL